MTVVAKLAKEEHSPELKREGEAGAMLLRLSPSLAFLWIPAVADAGVLEIAVQQK